MFFVGLPHIDKWKKKLGPIRAEKFRANFFLLQNRKLDKKWWSFYKIHFFKIIKGSGQNRSIKVEF